MKLILLSGGSGKRLWPISNNSRSKQFIKVLFNESKKEYESMIQRVWHQVNETGMQNDTFIISNKQQKDILESQVPSAKKIYEPERRDTFPAIALSCLYLKDVEKVPLEEEIIVSPVDPYVNNEYFIQMKKLPSLLSRESDLSLMGVSPKEASEKFGYIVKNSKESKKYSTVKTFLEKPDKALAEALIREGALWNCGVFCFKLEYILNILATKNLPTSYRDFLKIYKELESNSFDYEVVENTKNISVLEFDGLWKDLGTWSSLSEELDKNIIGNGYVDSSSSNTTIINELPTPIIGMNLHNLIIAASPEGILISEKEISDQLKNSLNHTNFHGILMYEERMWGHYKVLDYVRLNNGQEAITKKLIINKGKCISYQRHSQREEFWTIMSGEAKIIIDDKSFVARNSDRINIPKGSKHYIEAITDVEVIEIQTGIITEKDVIRFDVPVHSF